jgi:hypothetical protein
MLSVVSRNNILQMRSNLGKAIRDSSTVPTYDYDYDLISGMIVSAGKPESHAVFATPVYAPNRAPGDYSLDPGSPGFDAGERLPNFNDGFQGKGPDIGAFEAGNKPMQFGVNAGRDY